PRVAPARLTRLTRVLRISGVNRIIDSIDDATRSQIRRRREIRRLRPIRAKQVPAARGVQERLVARAVGEPGRGLRRRAVHLTATRAARAVDAIRLLIAAAGDRERAARPRRGFAV